MEHRPRLNPSQYGLVRGGRRKLVVGDLHEPFCRDGYMEFCSHIYDKYNCNSVMLIGDVIDAHFSSFHETDPDGHSAGEELRLAKKNIAKWYQLFPEADVCFGNHDLIPSRKAFNAGLSNRWVRTINEVLDVPNWRFNDEFIIDGVKYCHGTSRKAKARAKDDLISIVQGHYHSEGYIEHFVGDNYKIFAMQVGCGLDRSAYAAAYGKHFKKQHIGCGVVLENGTLPILEYMDL